MDALKLEDLNIDCLLKIFGLLNVEDQIAVALASDRLQFVTAIIWRKTFKRFDLNSVIGDVTKYCIGTLLKNICETVKTMDMVVDEHQEHHFRKYWDIIKLFKYPGVVNMNVSGFLDITDDDEAKMAECFPNLLGFTAFERTHIKGHHIHKFHNLRVLSLLNCEHLEFTTMEKILEHLNLETLWIGPLTGEVGWTSELAYKKFCQLKAISLGRVDEIKLLTDISMFHKLRDLIFNRQYEFIQNLDSLKVIRDIGKKKCDDLIKLQVYSHFPIIGLVRGNFANLTTVKLISRDSSDIVGILECAKNLREISLNRCRISRKEDILVWLKSPQMELVEVQLCDLEFCGLSVNVYDVVKNRTRTVEFIFYENFFKRSKVMVRIEGESPLFKLMKLQYRYEFNLNILRFKTN